MVAKYAGVSHMTIYRRWPTKGELFEDALSAEMHRVFAGAVQSAEKQPTLEGKIVTVFIETLWAAINHPLITRDVSTESDIVFPSLVGERSARSMQALIAATASLLHRWGVAEGVRIESRSTAEILVRMGHSLLLTTCTSAAPARKSAIGNYARRYVLPVAMATGVEPAAT
jgi:AcrR family transcriptional regulator